MSIISAIEAPAATAEQSPPRGNVRLLSLLLPASAAMYAGFQGLQQILIPVQVAALDAAHKIENLAMLTTLTSVASVLGLLAGGVLSDRTSGRFGRRAPWMVAGALVSSLLFMALGASASLVTVAVTYAALCFTLNVFAAAFTAILPDRIAVSARGTASAVLGLGTPLGVIIGVNYAAHVPQLTGYAGLACFLLLATGALVLFGREPAAARPAAISSLHLSTMFSSFTSRDFTLAFVSRACMFLGAFTVTGYCLYILQDHIGTADLPEHKPAVAVGVLGILQVVAWLASVPVAGWLADKFDRRKVVVGVASLGMAAAMVIPIVWPTWHGMVAFYITVGWFFGAYMTVDLALMSLVLPDKSAEGRDMALLAVATAGPQLLSSAIAGLIIHYCGYDQLFWFGAAVSVAGGLLVFLIRSVR